MVHLPPPPLKTYFMCTGILPACISAAHVCDTLKGQKKLTGPLEVWLQMVADYHVDAGNQAWILTEGSRAVRPPLPIPSLLFNAVFLRNDHKIS